MAKMSDDLARRASMWAATLRDDAATLREHARSAAEPRLRVELVSLANALNRAAKVLDEPAGQARTRRTKPAGKKKKKVKLPRKRKRRARASG